MEGSSSSTIDDKERYICISDGFSIYCVDLKKGKQEQHWNPSDPPLIPKLYSINLPEKGLPILSGLFKLGSNAYLIGGRQFPAMEKDHPHDWFMKIFDSFSGKSVLEGTSLVPYRLCLSDDTLSMTECKDIKPLVRPVCWPIVEKIGDEVHVIESFPKGLFDYIQPRRVRHEVLNLKNINDGWVENEHLLFEDKPISSHPYGPRMFGHLVVGDIIIGTAAYPCYKTLFFDSKCRKWEEDGDIEYHKTSPREIRHISQALQFGRGIRCIWKFQSIELEDSLYAVFALVNDDGDLIKALVYLVDYKGHVLTVQHVARFFEEDSPSFLRGHIEESIVIPVNEEKNTFCAIMCGSRIRKFKSSNCLLVYIFGVDVDHGGQWVAQREAAKRKNNPKGWEEGFAIPPKKFVKILVKERYGYKMDAPVYDVNRNSITRMQACFL